jgi:hypothetical protein
MSVQHSSAISLSENIMIASRACRDFLIPGGGTPSGDQNMANQSRPG